LNQGSGRYRSRFCIEWRRETEVWGQPRAGLPASEDALVVVM
jgi:hypothetical protein